MGHPLWGASDPNAALEKRRPWPPKAPELVPRFIEAVQRAAGRGQLLAVLAGHTHEDGVAVVPSLEGKDSGVKQFTTRPNFAGGQKAFYWRFGVEMEARSALRR